MKKFLSILMLVAALVVPWASRAQDTVTIGTGTSTTSNVPFSSLWGYSFVEQVYPAADIDMAGEITHVWFYLGQSYSSAQTNNIKLYMKNVTRSTFSGTTDYEPVTANDIVYEGSWTIPANHTGWVELELDTPFDYDGSSNLMVAMHEYTSGYSTRYFTYTDVTSSGIRFYSDSYNPDPYNLSSYSGSQAVISTLANMRLLITTGNITCYRIKNLTASDITPESVTLSWLDTNNSGATYTIIDLADSSVLAYDIADTSYTLTGLESDTVYTFGVYADCGSGDLSRVSNITVTIPPSCAVLTNIQATTTAGSVIFTWTPSISDAECSGLVEYREATDSTWTSAGDFQDSSATITDLTAGTDYVARLAALCYNGDTSNWQTVTFTTASLPCLVFDPDLSHLDTLGNGTSTQSYFPTYSLYDYSYSQQIFTAAELGGGGVLNSISVKCSTFYSQRNTEVYVDHVNVATSSSWLNPSDLTLVYSGMTNYAAGQWYTFEFTTPFAYNGSDNLLIVFRDMTGDWTSSNTFYYTAGTSGCSRYAYQDGTAYTVPPSATGTSSAYRCNMIFDFSACAQTASCAAPIAEVDSVGTTEVTVSWTPGYDETAWNVEYRVSGTTAWITADQDVTSTTYTYTNLEPATNYDLRVVTACDDTVFGSSVLTVFTNCVPVERLQENFNSYATGASADFNECWRKGVAGTTTNYPYVNTISNEKAMYFYGYNSNNTTHYSSWLITPEFADSLNMLNLEFDMYRTTSTNNYTSRLIIGAVANPSSISQMDTIEVIELSNATAAGVWMHQSVSLENYHGNGNHIVFLAPSTELFVTGTTTAYNIFYLDNLFIEPVDGCPHITRFHARDIMTNSAQLAWDNAAAYGSVTVKWGTTNSIVAATDSMTVNDVNELDLTGLNANTTYYCWATATCSEGTSFTTSCTFHTAALCNPVVDLTANEVSNSIATFSWNNDEVAPATSYIFSWKVDTVNTWTNINTNNTFYMLNGLTEGTTYNVKVAAVCTDTNSTEVTLNVTTSTTGTIGNDDGTYYIPTYPYYNNSISEQLWLDNELSTYSDTIYGIYFNAASDISGRPMKIWVGNTTLTDLSTSSYVPSTDMTLVYNATANITAGWNEFHFTTPFVRTEGSNLVVMAYDSADWESFDGWITSNSAVHSLYDYDDEEVFSNTDLSNLTVVAARAQMKLNATLLNPTCKAPHPVIASATSSSITIAWLPGENETSWSVEYRGMTDTAWTVATASTTDTFATVTNLAAATRYLFRINSLCSGETATATLLGRTACGAFTVPYIEDFNTMSGGDYVMNACWTKGTTGTGDTPYTVNITNEGMMSVMPRGSYIIFPTMDQPISDLQLRMRYVAADTTIFTVVGVCTHEGDIYSFVPFDTIWCESAGVGAWSTTLFEDYEGTTGQIAIYSWYNQSYIDDINIELAPNCAPVTAITLAGATTTSATLEWAAAPNATAYILNYWLVGDSTVNTQTVTGTSVVLNGLQHSTTYMANLTTICSLLGDTSLTSNNLTFKTECAPVSLPYVQDFDHSNAPALTYTGILPNCWNAVDLATGTYSAADYHAQIYSSSTNAHSGQYSLMMYGLAVVALPEMPTSVDSLQLSFHEYNASTGYYGLIIGVCDSITPGFQASFVPVDTLYASATNTDHTTYKLATYTGQGRYIAFKNFYIGSTTTQYSVHYIDDIVVDYLPSCLPVTNISAILDSASSITLDWDDVIPATEWEISYSTTALTDPNLGTIVSASAHPFQVDNLSDAHSYYFYIRNVCGAGDSSTWTAAGPYRCHIMNMTPNTTDTIYACGGTIYDDGGPTGDYSISQDSYIILMPSDVSSLVSVSGTSRTEGSWDYLSIYDGIGATGTPLWTDNGVSTLQNFGPITSSSGPLTIYFHSDGTIVYEGFSINVNCIADDCPVSDLMIDTNQTTTSTSIPLIWDGSSTLYQIEYGATGFTQGTGTMTTSTTNSYLLDNLEPTHTYDFYVRGLCNTSDTGLWHMITVTTPMCDNVISVATGDPDSTTSTGSVPVNNYYKYTLTETIIDSAELGGPMEISTIGYYYNYSSPSTKKTNVTIWIQPTNKSEFAGSSTTASEFIALDTTIAVQVYHGNLNCTQGWNFFPFDNTYNYDGQGNLVVIVDDNSNQYDGSGYYFKTIASTQYKTLACYSDSYNPDPLNISAYSSTKYRYQYRPVMQLISCGAACAKPQIASFDTTYNSITLNWANSDSSEVAISQGLWDETTAQTATVTPGAHTYTFTGLQPNTQYTVAVRNLCEDNVVSDWSTLTITTPDLPCFAPENVTVTNIGPSGAKVSWTPVGNENEWIVKVYRGTVETHYDTVINNHYCNVSGLYSATTYSVTVMAVCGDGVESEWSDDTTFTTTECVAPSNVNATVSGRNAVVTWNATGADEYHVLWFEAGFTIDGDSVIVTNGTTNATITGLEGGQDYDIYVYAYCDGHRSTQAGQTTIHVTGIDDANGSLINLYPNPASTTVTIDGIVSEVLVTIVDMNGRTVYSEKTVSNLTIDLAGMAKGAYFVRIMGENTTAIRKLIVK